MSKENHEQKKRVSRQSWKPNGFLKVVYNLWIAAYSVLKIALGALATVLVIVGVCAVVFVGILGDYLQNDILPQAGIQLEGFDLDQDSFIYYLDENDNIQVLQKIYADTSSQWASYDQIPKDLVHAAVSIEDERFFEHQGVDWITTIKACLNMFMGGDSEFGGSTITQQLVKNVLEEDAKTVQRKVLEIFRATMLEKRYDKEVIMEWYMNYIFLGNRCKGVKAGAAKYFGKELENLTTAECASLISITNNPSKFNPYRETLDKDGKTGMEQNTKRKTNTLWMMRNLGWLTEEEYQEALNQEIVLKDGIDFEDQMENCPEEGCGYRGMVSSFLKKDDGIYYCPQCGVSTTIGEDASQEVYSYFVETVLEDVAMWMANRDGIEWGSKSVRDTYMNLIGRGGYHIYSTFDAKAQAAVDKIYTDLDEIPEDRSGQQLQSAIVLIDNKTGDIIAMSGGVGEKTGFDVLNRATDSKLQPGSSIKPLTIYSPAFELGVITPASVIKDMPLEYNNGTPFPRNDNRRYGYSNTISTGIASSLNAVASNTLMTIGVDYSYDFAKNKFGLSYLTDHYVNSAGSVFTDKNIAPLALGAPTIGVTVRQMSSAYATFANDGVYREARTYTKVYNSNGDVVIDNAQKQETILSEKAINYMNYCLEAGVAWGTGKAAELTEIGQIAAGKTGSTSSMKDRWFCGFTAHYTAAVWVGYDIPEVINLVGNTSNPACRLWKKVMLQMHDGLKKNVELYDDSNFRSVYVCLDSGKLATDACRQDCRGIERVKEGRCLDVDIPTEPCDKHILVDFCQTCDAVATEYCKHFAEIGQATITKISLLKLTKTEIDELCKASDGNGLSSSYINSKVVYLVDAHGNPQNFYGIYGDLNQNQAAPYIVCTTHTKEAWDLYLSQLPDPNPPEDPVIPPEESTPDPEVPEVTE